jgi:hypothetical protein
MATDTRTTVYLKPKKVKAATTDRTVSDLVMKRFERMHLTSMQWRSAARNRLGRLRQLVLQPHRRAARVSFLS